MVSKDILKSIRTSASDWGRIFSSKVNLAIFLLLISQIAIHSQRIFINKTAPGLNLSGEWQYCLPKKTLATDQTISETLLGCVWLGISMPTTNIHGLRVAANEPVVFRKITAFPNSCSDRLQECGIYIEEIGAPAAVYVNRHLIGEYGKYPAGSNLIWLYPFWAYLPSYALADEGNEILVFTSAGKGGQTGIIAPIRIAPALDVRRWVQLYNLDVTIFPILSAFGLLILAIIAFLLAPALRNSNNLSRNFIYYCLTNFLYLISLSRIPKEFLDYGIGVAIHWALLALASLWHIELAKSIFNYQITFWRLLGYLMRFFLFYFAACILLVFLGIGINYVASGATMLAVARFAISFECFIPQVAIAIAATRMPSLRKFAWALFIIAILKGYDSAALIGYVPGIYFTRFVNFTEALIFGLIIWEHFLNDFKIQQHLASLADVAQKVSHDIKSPLAALNVLARSLPDDLKDEKLMISEITDRVRRIASEILTIEKSKYQKISEQNRVSEVIERLLKSKRAELTTHTELIIHARTESDGYIAEDNAHELMVVLSNLVNNSAEALHYKGKIEIYGYNGYQFYFIEVLDNGPGIRTDIIDQLGKVPIESTKPEGSGIGILNSRKRMKKIGGDLKLDKGHTGGARIILSLPISRGDRAVSKSDI